MASTDIQDPSTLGGIPLFRGLQPGDLAKVQRQLHVRTFPPRSQIVSADQPGEAAYLVLYGTVKVHVEQPNGTDVILAILGRGELIGEMSLVDSLGRSATVETIEESTLTWMDRAFFEQCVRTIPAFAHNLSTILTRRLRLANSQIEALAALDVYGRVARQLLAFAREYGEETPAGHVVIPLRLSQNELAGLVGASRVRVNQVLAAFKRVGSIEIDARHRLTIRTPSALERYCV